MCYHCSYVCVAGSLCVITARMFVLQEVCVLSLLVCLCCRKFVCYHCSYVCVAGSLCVITARMFVLYMKFVTCPNFTHWFMLRREEANQKLRLLHLDTLCRAVSFEQIL